MWLYEVKMSPHFMTKKMGSERLINLPKVAQLVGGRKV